MEDFKLKLNLIIDILREKNTKLQTLAIITENQGTVLESKEKSKETMEMLTNLIDEKQKLIDEILRFDDVFLKKYEEIKDFFDVEEIRRENREAILEMQELIVAINEGNDKVITLERANDEIARKLREGIEEKTKQMKITQSTDIPNAGQAPMSAEHVNTVKTLQNNKKVNSVTKKPIATLNIKEELEKANSTREKVFTNKHETGKKYRLKSVIEQYRNNRR